MINIVNNTVKKVTFIAVFLAFCFSYGCDDMLDRNPQGRLSESVFTTKAAIEKLLISCYSPLSGMTSASPGGQGNIGGWQSSPDNMYYGDMGPGNMHKGSTTGDQASFLLQERFLATSDNIPNPLTKWNVMYAAIDRCNDVLRTLNENEISDLSDADRNQIIAEARYLRGYYHFEVKKMWNMVPYIDETVTDLQRRVPNDRDIWPFIEADFLFAANTLPPAQAEPGRPTNWAAKAFLAKAYLFQQKYSDAKPLVDDIIINGPHQLNENYFDNFNAENNNGIESVWQNQVAVNVAGAGFHRSQRGGDLAYPSGSGIPALTGAGFNQPTFDLVNAFKTGTDGLPLIDTFWEEEFHNDMDVLPTQPFQPDMTTPVDPRLDWTVGRRGVPFHDWGLHGEGIDWIRDRASAGPYNQKKMIILRSQMDRYAHLGEAKFNAMNFNIIRYAQVLLWAAECEIEIGDPEKAREYVNMIRARARDGYYVRLGEDAPFGDGPTAANYVVDEYKESWAGRDKDWMRKRVRFEHRLEFALEGHYFFDLIRWNVDVEYINAYIGREKGRITYLNDVVYTINKRYLPIPLQQIDRSYLNGAPTLTQNNYEY